MDEETKKIIIVAVVVAVAAYLLWKRGKGNAAVKGGTAGGDISEPAEPVLTEDQIIARLTSCPAGHKKYLTQNVAAINSSPMYVAEVQRKATDAGTTYPKQCVMDASWLVYRTGDNANAGWAADMHNKICAEVQAM